MRFHVDIHGFLSSSLRWKLAEFLLTHEASMSEREIASILRLSHMSVNRVMLELANLNFVRYKTVGKAHIWTVNQKSYSFRVISKIFRAIHSCPTPVVELKRLILKHLPRGKVKELFLFGSVARGEEKENSDIDLLIVVQTDKDKAKIEPAIDLLSSECIDLFGNQLSVHLLNVKEWEQKKSLQVIQEALKGINLYDTKV